MTMQTDAPLQRVAQSQGQEPLRQIARYPFLVLDPPYQRGSIWGTRRRRNLIRSLLMGVPIGNVFLNVRPDADISLAVVDGKQRIETVIAFLDGALSVPASWFRREDVLHSEPTNDGPYVRYQGLSPRGQAMFDRCSVTTQRTDLPTIEAEAALFDLINYGGVPPGASDDD